MPEDDEILNDQTTEDPSTDGQDDSGSTEPTNDENTTTDTPSTNTNTDTNTTTPVNLIEVLNLTSIPINIPIDFLFVYNKLLLVMVELGESMLRSCDALCNNKNMPIVECYHMFKAALAAKQLAATSTTTDPASSNYYAKIASTLLNYVKTQLNCIVENYKDTVSFTIPYDANGTVNLFITINNNNVTEIIADPADSSIIEELINNMSNKVILQGNVVTPDSADTYGLTEDELATYSYWHVIPGHEFVPGSTVVHINGVLYILDDNDYEEWIVVENGVSIGVGIRLLTGSFDVGTNSDEIYIEGLLLADTQDNNSDNTDANNSDDNSNDNENTDD